MYSKMRKIILSICAMLLFVACTDKNQAIQIIAGPTDCQESVGCSWNDGIATFPSYVGPGEYYFNFNVKEQGELVFLYKLESWSYQGYEQSGWLCVYLDDAKVFDESGKLSYYKKVSLGAVKKGTVIKVEGKKSNIKDIMILGDVNEGKPSQWDF